MDSYAVKKQKITLEDYDYQQDLENRVLMSQFSAQDLVVLEEILYSSLRIPLKKMEKNLDLTAQELLPALMKLSQTGLFLFEQDCIVVDKEKRKYFEAEVVKFEEGFKPGMDFLQGLMRKVPIHVLPGWYSLPRLSDHIFESILEKYLLTPQIFQRYLADLTFTDPLLLSIVRELYESPDLKLYAKHLIQKHQLSRETFEKALLQIEFHLVGFLRYERCGDHYEEVITPFQEWCDYAEFLKQTTTHAVPHTCKVQRFRPDDFSYVQDLSALLTLSKQEPVQLKTAAGLKTIRKQLAPWEGTEESFSAYLQRLMTTVCQLKLASLSDHRLLALESASDFLEMSSSEQALFLYRHPFNRSAFKQIPVELLTDRNLREAEKSILRVLNTGWVYFDEFSKGVIVSLTETSTLSLKKQGKHWKYSLPSYSDAEQALIQAVVLEWLFEAGITAIGTAEDRLCFTVTDFGRSLYGQE